MMDINMEELFGLRPFKQDKPKEKLPVKVATLRKFFSDRYISNAKIGKVIGVSGVLVGKWFSGGKPIPKEREVKLLELKQEFIEWENEHGRMFNSGWDNQ